MAAGHTSRESSSRCITAVAMFPVGVASSSRGSTYANEARDRCAPIAVDLKISVTGRGKGIIKRRELARGHPVP